MGEFAKFMKPKISVIMAVYNEENYINEAIESILKQTFTDFEFIIVNDGSTDSSKAIIKSYTDKRIKLINQSNEGVAKARNAGVKESKGKYIAILDADDISEPNRIKRQYNFLVYNHNYIAIESNAILLDMENNFIYRSNLPLSDYKMKEILPEFPTFHPSLMFYKNVFSQVGGYPDYMLKGEDLVMFNRIVKYGKISNIKEQRVNDK